MKVTRRTRLLVRAQSVLFVVLLLAVMGLIAWASTRYSVQMDWTAQGRNTLSEPSRRLLGRLEGPVRITAFATQNSALRTAISDLVSRYQREKPDVSLEFVNPDTAPDRVRQLGIQVDGELLVAYGGRTEHVRRSSEQTLTNALQRLARGGERWIAYLTGHGERDLRGQANYDLGEWGGELAKRGFKVRPLNLAQAGEVPKNTAVLVIAGPQVDLLPGEIAAIERYVKAGGNLLWLTDPGPQHGLQALARSLGVTLRDGVIVDPTLQVFGVDDPTFVPATRYAQHPATRGFDRLTVYPKAGALEAKPHDGWQPTSIVQTSANAWLETGPLKGDITFDKGRDAAGPLAIGIALQRESEKRASQGDDPGAGQSEPAGAALQRVVVMADGDFLSNAYLGNQGNLDLGMNLMNWLSRDEKLIDIPARTAPDLTLELSRPASFVIGLGSVLGMPLLLFATGIGIWLRRRRR